MDANAQILELFEVFKELHPNNSERFAPSIENAMRWRYAINAAHQRGATMPKDFVLPDSSLSILFANSRRILRFESFPMTTQEVYKRVAALFPGRKVYAVGSRVSGEYIDETSGEKVKQMRSDLMKKPTTVSDYDFTLDLLPGESVESIRSLLPKGVDFVAHHPKSDPKLLIPMWDFSKLPVERHNEVIELFEKKQWGKLMDIHNEFQLSEQTLCCNSKSAQKWFAWAIENQIIRKQ